MKINENLRNVIFEAIDNVQPDILGRAYEYLIKQFADDAGAKAGEFLTPPKVVDILIRILEPQLGETVYDPTYGFGGMLIHSVDFLIEIGHRSSQVRYRGRRCPAPPKRKFLSPTSDWRINTPIIGGGINSTRALIGDQG